MTSAEHDDLRNQLGAYVLGGLTPAENAEVQLHLSTCPTCAADVHAMQAPMQALALSVDPVESHKKWIDDINDTQKTTVNFPIIADADRKVSLLYDMIHPNASATQTVRSVFIIDPAKKVRLMLTYPASTGRNFDEILRVIDSIQLTEYNQVATPVNWKNGDDVVIVPALQDPEVIKQKFPKGYKALRPYLRMTPQPDLKR